MEKTTKKKEGDVNILKAFILTIVLMFGTGSIITALFAGLESDWWSFTFAIFISFISYFVYTIVVIDERERKN